MTKHSSIQSQHSIKKLSKTELDILRYIKNEHTSAEIALIRNCSRRTVEKHRSNIIHKLEIKSSQMALLVWTKKNSII